MPEPSVYNPLGVPFIELLSVDSTNNYALTQVHGGLAQHGMAFFTNEQVAGKGQRGKTWTSPKNTSLILSVVIDPQLSISQQFQLSACIAVAVHEFFNHYAGRATRIKWPNDLYWNDRKAGGILIENIIGSKRADTPDNKSAKITERTVSPKPNGSDQPATQWLWAVAGIGININQVSFPAELKNPVSLKQITGKNFEPAQLAKELCTILDKNFKDLITNGFHDIYTSYLACLYKKNETVRLRKNNRVFDAVIKSVSPAGELLVEHAIEESFGFGEIEWIIPASGEPEK